MLLYRVEKKRSDKMKKQIIAGITVTACVVLRAAGDNRRHHIHRASAAGEEGQHPAAVQTKR